MRRDPIKLIKNINLLNKLTFSEKNYNSEKDSYDYISPNNHMYILSTMIFNYLNELKTSYNQEVIFKLATEYDLTHTYDDKPRYRSKEYILDNFVNFEFHHHREIILEELYSDEDFINKKLGFDPKIVNVIKHQIFGEKLIIYHIDADDFPIQIKNQVSNFLYAFSSDINELFGKTIDEIKFHLEDYPIIKVRDFHCLSSMINLNMNYRRLLNYRLKDIQEFKKHKGTKFENTVFKLISFYAKGNTYSDVRYGKYQSDIVLDEEDSIYVIECKAIDLYDDYKRNKNTEFIYKNIQSILDEALVQGERFFDHVYEEQWFNTAQGKIQFSKEKEKYIVSVSLESPFGELRTSKYNFINLSFSDLAIILETSSRRLYKDQNYSYGFDAIKEMVRTKLDLDNTVNYFLLLTLKKYLIELAKKNNVDFNVNFKVLNEYDQAFLKMMYSVEDADDVSKVLLGNKEWMALYISSKQNILRRTFKVF